MKIPYNILIQIKMSVRPYFKGFTLIFFFYNCRKQDYSISAMEKLYEKNGELPWKDADADTMSAPAVQTKKKLHPETGEVFPFYSIMIVFFSGSFSTSFGKLIFSSPFS